MTDKRLASARKLVSQLKVIYTDVDGTMVGTGGSILHDSDGNVTLNGVKAIAKALEANIDVVMISGRNRNQLKEDARILGLKNYIAELGAEIIYERGNRIITTVEGFDTENGNVFEIIKDSRIIEKLFSHFDNSLEYHTPWSDEKRFHSHLLRGHIDVAEGNKWLREQGQENLKLVDNGRLRSRGEIMNNLSELHCYHLLPCSVDKAVALRRDREERRINRDETIALGDSWADLSLAPEVGAFFLMPNGLKNDPSLEKEIEKLDNVFVPEEERVLGWAESINLFVE